MTYDLTLNYPQVARDAGFKLRQFKDGPLDWRLIGTFEVDRILRDQTLEKLDSVLLHLSEVPLGYILETNILDSSISKYFMLSQFAVQYLYFCRKFLDETIKELRDSLAESEKTVANLKRSLTESNNEVVQLNKKITQLEALHEVVYPCHLCTKNFISNDALNIHLDRKHSVRNSIEKRVTPQMGSQNDITLINTIKLELEIKQLKERLNTAEKIIRDRNATTEYPSGGNTKKEQNATKNVAIQSNLTEAKEKDDSDDSRHTELLEHKEEIAKLQEKMHEFEEWKKIQKANSEEYIAEINEKLKSFAQTLDDSKVSNKTVAEIGETVQSTASPSEENLESLLNQKVAKIEQANAERLQEVLRNMEANYNKKLEEMRAEVNAREIVMQSKIPVRKVFNLAKKQTNSKVLDHETKRQPIDRNAKAKDDEYIVPVAIKEKPTEKSSDDTYIIEDMNLKSKIATNSRVNKHPTEEKKKTIDTADMSSSSVESNRTFVKSMQRDQTKEAVIEKDERSDMTDISESLDEESIQSVEKRNNLPITTKTGNVSNSFEDSAKARKTGPKKRNLEKKPSQSAPKRFTRKDAKKLANDRLYDIGLNMRTTSISNSSMKRISDERLEKRNKLKQKFPNFLVTRNKIKKFVDKICSTRLPEDAEIMLKSTKLLQPAEKLAFSPSSPQSTPNSSFDSLELNSSTPKTSKAINNQAFKERLERILVSPIHKPNSKVTADKVSLNRSDFPDKPVPMPRKRVMFNTGIDLHGSVDSTQISEHGSPPKSNFGHLL